MSKTIQIKKEHLAKRCDICHQADLFIPETGSCTRCSLFQLQPQGQKTDEFRLYLRQYSLQNKYAGNRAVGIVVQFIFVVGVAVFTQIGLEKLKLTDGPFLSPAGIVISLAVTFGLLPLGLYVIGALSKRCPNCQQGNPLRQEKTQIPGTCWKCGEKLE